MLAYMHDKASYDVSLKDRAHLLFNMAKKDIYDPVIYEKFEQTYKTTTNRKLCARMSFGALWAYYQTNMGTRFGIDFWESQLEDDLNEMHAQEVHELMQAFRKNRTLERKHFHKLLDTQFKKVLIDKWKTEVLFN